jgi:cytoskeletal protein CcmA (bactofilin family)
MSALLAVFAVLLAGYVALRATRVAVRARHQKLFHSQGEPSDITTSATSTLGGPDQSFSIQGDDLMTARIAPTAQAGGVRAANAPTLLTILGASAKIEGIFEVEESIEVQCEISGELRVGGTLVVGERGRVSADVTTVSAIINGSYTGNLKASGSVEIAATGRVSGTLESSELVIAKGGVFTGSVTHVDTETQDQLETEALLPRTGMLTDVEKPIPVTRLIELDLGKGISSARGGGAFQPPAH